MLSHILQKTTRLQPQVLSDFSHMKNIHNSCTSKENLLKRALFTQRCGGKKRKKTWSHFPAIFPAGLSGSNYSCASNPTHTPTTQTHAGLRAPPRQETVNFLKSSRPPACSRPLRDISQAFGKSFSLSALSLGVTAAHDMWKPKQRFDALCTQQVCALLLMN